MIKRFKIKAMIEFMIIMTMLAGCSSFQGTRKTKNKDDGFTVVEYKVETMNPYVEFQLSKIEKIEVQMVKLINSQMVLQER